MKKLRHRNASIHRHQQRYTCFRRTGVECSYKWKGDGHSGVQCMRQCLRVFHATATHPRRWVETHSLDLCPVALTSAFLSIVSEQQAGRLVREVMLEGHCEQQLQQGRGGGLGRQGERGEGVSSNRIGPLAPKPSHYSAATEIAHNGVDNQVARTLMKGIDVLVSQSKGSCTPHLLLNGVTPHLSERTSQRRKMQLGQRFAVS